MNPEDSVVCGDSPSALFTTRPLKGGRVLSHNAVGNAIIQIRDVPFRWDVIRDYDVGCIALVSRFFPGVCVCFFACRVRCFFRVRFNMFRRVFYCRSIYKFL